MNENTKAVDVLAVLDEVVRDLDDMRLCSLHVAKARAAVAELIAAAKAVHSKVIVSHESWDAVERLGDALARCGVSS